MARWLVAETRAMIKAMVAIRIIRSERFMHKPTHFYALIGLFGAACAECAGATQDNLFDLSLEQLVQINHQRKARETMGRGCANCRCLHWCATA